MMSTLNSTALNLNHSQAVNTTPGSQPQSAVAQNKRFAQIMAKAQATSPQTAQTPPNSATAKSAPPANTAQSGPTTEASRAEANARENAKTAARAIANRALLKVPASELNPPTEPHVEPHIEPHRAASDSAPMDAVNADNTTDVSSAALSADMAAWVAALNPAFVRPSTAATAPPSGDTSVIESELSTHMVAQSTRQTAVNNNTQVLREEADASDEGHAQQGVASQRASDDSNRSHTGSDGASSSRHNAQQPDVRGTRDLSDARAAARTPTAPQAGTLTTTAAGDVAAASSAAAGLSMALLGQESTRPATKTAANTADFSALMAGGASTANGLNGNSAAETAATTLNLFTPVNAPEFREALGVQVSLLAQGGVQTAELHLNPADMGPVSIQIVMDGTQARVDFGADVAATRSAIEASMPALASALQDAGFTLAGGGVSQHAQGQRNARDDETGGNRQGVARLNSAATQTNLRLPIEPSVQQRLSLTAGGVDLFA